MDTNELKLSVSSNEICRTCLAAVEPAKLKPIFCNEILDGRIVPFPNVVEFATGEKLTRNEKLPDNVCVECKVKLRETYIFMDKIRKSTKLLYEIFSVEPPEQPQAVQQNKETKTAETQTESVDVDKKNIDQAALGCVLMEKETQCDLTRSVNTSADATCQTELTIGDENSSDVLSEQMNTTAASFEDVEDVSMGSATNDSPANFTLNTVANEEDLTDGEGEYHMILIADGPTEEACYAISEVAAKEKLTTENPRRKGATWKRHQSAGGVVARSSPRKQSGRKQHCEYCEFAYPSESVTNHIEIHRVTLEQCFESLNYYRCSMCFMTFISQTHFDAHFDETCQPQPNEELLENPDVQRHERFYLNGIDVCVPKLKTFKMLVEEACYSCARCPTTTPSFEEMRQHCQSHDDEDDRTDNVDFLWKQNGLDKVHVCGLCQAQFPDALYIRQHLFFHQCSFFCPYDCNTSFEKFLNLTRHIERVHLPDSEFNIQEGSRPVVGDKKFQCDRCGRSYRFADELEEHVSRHLRERKYVCPVCNSCFAQKGDLNTHCRIHTNERPYPCEICDKTFRTTSHRRDHMSTHEPVNKYECDVCSKRFKAERILAEHKRLHTGQKPFRCQVCDKEFARRHHLKLHCKVHDKSPKA